jgi:hypothetical protein
LLGNPDYLDSEEPVAVAMPNVPGGFSAIALGDIAACGLAGGRAYCWGSGIAGQMGNGELVYANPSPRAVDTSGVLLRKALVSISGGSTHFCARCRHDRMHIGRRPQAPWERFNCGAVPSWWTRPVH